MMPETQAAHSLDALRILAEPVDHVEGLAVAPDGALWGGGEAGQIYRIEPDGGVCEQIVETQAGMLLGLAAGARGRLCLCALPELP